MNRIEESRMSFSSVDEGSDSEISPTTEPRPSSSNWTVSNARSGAIPGGQFELPIATPPTATTTPSQTPTLPRERALSATDALFESSRKRASSETDKTKPVKEGTRRTLFSRPAKIMTNLAGVGKDKGKDKVVVSLEKDDGSPISPTYFRPFASPSNLRPRLSQDETSRTFSIGNSSSTPAEGIYALLPPPTTATGSTPSSSVLRPQLFHRARERKDSNPTSISVSTVLSKQNSSESNLSHSPASPSLFPVMDRIAGAMPKSVSTQDIRQLSAGHYTADGAPVMDDPWPLLRARGLGLFHGEGMRINIEELNKLVLYVTLALGRN